MSKKTAQCIRIIGALLFLFYLTALCYFLFFSERYGRTAGENILRYNLQPFKEIRRFWGVRHTMGWRVTLLNLAGNVAAFLPFGSIAPVLWKKMRHPAKICACGAGLSLCVEVLQLLTRLGSFDVDDILLNTLGAGLGYTLFAVCNRLRRRIEIRREYGK